MPPLPTQTGVFPNKNVPKVPDKLKVPWEYENMVVVRVLKDILSIKIKPRHDDICDQFNRLFMVKMLLIASVIMGFDYFSDRVSCMMPKESNLSKDFVHSVCWISGFYIFKEMREEIRLVKSSYYGIPNRVEHDGLDKKGKLCGMIADDDCSPMSKIYYLHYQWMPFYIGALSVFFYMPYVIFRMVNSDLVSLKAAMMSTTGAQDQIVENYFNYRVNSLSQLRLRIWWNISVKMLYLFFSLVSFFLTDYLLLGNYLTYGRDYLVWYEKHLTIEHVGNPITLQPKAGNILLPSMGYCDIREASLDTRTVFHNTNRVICEISPNILYQYVLMVLWFFFVASIAVSVAGFFSYLGGHIYRMIFFSSPKNSIYGCLSLREIEYLQFIKKKNLVVYGDVLRKLKQHRFHATYDKESAGSEYEASNNLI